MFDEENNDSLSNILSGKVITDDFDDFGDTDSIDTPVENTEIDQNKRQRSPSPDLKEEEKEIKRLRIEDMAHAQPIVADTFQEETSREVSNVPGLQGAPVMAEPQLTLKHQVSINIKSFKKKLITIITLSILNIFLLLLLLIIILILYLLSHIY